MNNVSIQSKIKQNFQVMQQLNVFLEKLSNQGEFIKLKKRKPKFRLPFKFQILDN